MGNSKQPHNGSRRWFFDRLFSAKKDISPGEKSVEGEMVKMLTADGKLVEVSKTILDQASKNKKASNKEIFHWMKNPSKKNS